MSVGACRQGARDGSEAAMDSTPRATRKGSAEHLRIHTQLRWNAIIVVDFTAAFGPPVIFPSAG